MKRAFLIALLISLVSPLWAAEVEDPTTVTDAVDTTTTKKSALHKLAKWMEVFYYKKDIDTNYVTRPKERWTIKPNVRLSRRDTEWEGLADETMKSIMGENADRGKLEFNGRTSVAIGCGIYYRGLGINLAINPFKQKKKGKDYELTLRYFGSRFGGSIGYEQNERMEATLTFGNVSKEMSMLNIRNRLFSASGYYVFNYRRFSMPAAFTQSYIQKRSAGSFMLGLTYFHNTLDYESYKDPSNPDFDVAGMKIRTHALGIGAGYGHNFVPGRGWLLHISTMPTLIALCDASYEYDDAKESIPRNFPEFNIESRAAAVYRFGKCFTGLQMTHNLIHLGKKDDLSRSFKLWGRAVFGYRF